MPYKIYVADDEENIRQILSSFLADAGYEVTAFPDGDSLYAHFQKDSCDCVILDIMMPGSSGLVICQNLRQISSVPIILLTAKDDELDFILGINSGADDYITKPFRPSILVTKIKAILRRIGMQEATTEDKQLSYGDLVYVTDDHAIFVGEANLNLTQTELQVLHYLLKQAGKAVSKERLLEEVWGFESAVESRVTDETVRRIRKKMAQSASRVLIKTIWGYGYKLEDLGEEE